MRSSIVKTDHFAEEDHQPCHFSGSDNEEVISHLVMGIIWKMFDLVGWLIGSKFLNFDMEMFVS